MTIKNHNSLVYLACPYSHKDKEVMQKRFKLVTRVAAELTKKYMWVFSPITHSNEMHLSTQLPHTWEFWAAIDIAFMNRCNELYVVTIDGWKESVGVTAEIQHALENDMKITLIHPSELGIINNVF